MLSLPHIGAETAALAAPPRDTISFVHDDHGGTMPTTTQTFPKIELHVHLEGTVRPATLLAIARRNGYRLPADSVEGLAELCTFRDFPHFLSVWMATTPALQTADDFRRVVVDYATEAAGHGAVYLEAHLLAGRAGRPRHRLAGGLRGLLRRRPARRASGWASRSG